MYGRIISPMSKPSNRQKILDEGLKVVHRLGFGGASVRDIVQAAGVPQGSFTNHFASKEAFGLEVLDLYFTSTHDVLEATLRNDALPPLARLRNFISANRDRLSDEGMENGCLYGNMTGEAVDHSEPIRNKLNGIFDQVRKAVSYCLCAAMAAGELPKTIDPESVAEFIVGGLQGAIMLSKVQRSVVPIERFEQLLFNMVLGRPDVVAPALDSIGRRSATAA
jgi:TetR/AcrR family transcriptional repressor of nem operon